MSETTYSCPVCGTVHEHQSERYKNHVCRDCEKRARCSHDRNVFGFNTHMSGGFAAHHADRGDNDCEQVTTDHRVWIDGTEYKMQEARFGGTVVTPIIVVESVRDVLVWKTDGPRQFTASPETGVYLGTLVEVPGKRHFFRRDPSKWEWQVSNVHNRVVYKNGVEPTEAEAKNAVVDAIDAILTYEAQA